MEIPDEPRELSYLEPFFQTLGPRAVPLKGKKGFRFVCSDLEWKKIIGMVTGHNIYSIRRRAKYRIFKELEARNQITFCKECHNIIGCKVIDGFNRPWENVCANCISSPGQ